MTTVEEKLEVNLSFMRIASMMVKLLFLSHILACFWFYIAALMGEDETIPTWVSHYDHGSGLTETAPVQYLYSMYWALTTLTTVSAGARMCSP